MACKECAEAFAAIAAERGWQTLNFDLPDHGERRNHGEVCDVFAGVRDLNAMADYAFSHWTAVALYGCSLGAYFSLCALADRPIVNCLFQSPIVDMEHLIRKMFDWFCVTEERLEREGEIPTAIDTLSWKYFQLCSPTPSRAGRRPRRFSMQPETNCRAGRSSTPSAPLTAVVLPWLTTANTPSWPPATQPS